MVLNHVACPSPLGDGASALAASPSASSRLLILSCSQVKAAGAGLMPAWQRYRGPLWLDLQKHDPKREMARVAFLSGRYGIMPADTPIEDYDEKLTIARATSLAARPDLAAPIARDLTEVEEVALVGGGVYVSLMRLAVERLCHARRVPRIFEIKDQTGYMRLKMAAWLKAGGAK